ncbi:hypothetical protein MTBSS4_340006 [Magnetospirillum sp. SS-4]|nr:hypothetical protein MTBSS4_340006 [Magnetospirillum sp. SS-4]
MPLKDVFLDALRKPKMPPSRDRRLHHGEMELIRDAALAGNTVYIWDVIQFALETAMRQSEILGLTWQTVSISKKMVFLPLTKNGLGMSLYAKRLEKGRFIWPSPADGVVAISPAQLAYMLDGIDWRSPRHTFRPQSAG